MRSWTSIVLSVRTLYDIDNGNHTMFVPMQFISTFYCFEVENNVFDVDLKLISYHNEISRCEAYEHHARYPKVHPIFTVEIHLKVK